MTDYWKSNDKKYCDFCKCWIADNKASVAFHESGKRHKLNVAKRLSDISRSSEKNEKERQKMDAEIRKMEEAAMRSYAQDIHARADMTSKSIGMVMDAKAAQLTFAASSSSSTQAASSAGARQVDPMRLPGNSDDEDDDRRVRVQKVDPETVPNASLWVECKTEDGKYSYYWNVKTNESVWEPPKEGFLSHEEYERINQIAAQQQSMLEAQEAKKFRENADEEVAKYNREKLKAYRAKTQAKTAVEKQAIAEAKANYKTEEEAATQPIGEWQVVENKPAAAPIDWQLPQVSHHYIPAPVIIDEPAPPPVKRFKEKTIESLDKGFGESSSSTTFKKRKFAAKANARQRLNDD